MKRRHRGKGVAKDLYRAAKIGYKAYKGVKNTYGKVKNTWQKAKQKVVNVKNKILGIKPPPPPKTKVEKLKDLATKFVPSIDNIKDLGSQGKDLAAATKASLPGIPGLSQIKKAYHRMPKILPTLTDLGEFGSEGLTNTLNSVLTPMATKFWGPSQAPQVEPEPEDEFHDAVEGEGRKRRIGRKKKGGVFTKKNGVLTQHPLYGVSGTKPLGMGRKKRTKKIY